MSDVTGEALVHNFSQQWSNVGHAEQVSFDQLCARTHFFGKCYKQLVSQILQKVCKRRPKKGNLDKDQLLDHSFALNFTTP